MPIQLFLPLASPRVDDPWSGAQVDFMSGRTAAHNVCLRSFFVYSAFSWRRKKEVRRRRERKEEEIEKELQRRMALWVRCIELNFKRKSRTARFEPVAGSNLAVRLFLLKIFCFIKIFFIPKREFQASTRIYSKKNCIFLYFLLFSSDISSLTFANFIGRKMLLYTLYFLCICCAINVFFDSGEVVYSNMKRSLRNYYVKSVELVTQMARNVVRDIDPEVRRVKLRFSHAIIVHDQ